MEEQHSVVGVCEFWHPQRYQLAKEASISLNVLVARGGLFYARSWCNLESRLKRHSLFLVEYGYSGQWPFFGEASYWAIYELPY